MSDKQSSKNGAASTWHAKHDDKRRAEARRLISLLNAMDSREWWSEAQRSNARRKILEGS